MEPDVRYFADPLEGLSSQLRALRAFATEVPPLIEAHRQALWDKIASSPGDGEEETIDVYDRETRGQGFADYERTVHSAALVLGWEVFRDFLNLHLAERTSGHMRHGSVRSEEEVRLAKLPLPKLKDEYKKAGIVLDKIEGWDWVRQLQLTRNAIVHNLGLYTREYFAGPAPVYPTREDMAGFEPTSDMGPSERRSFLTDNEQIPLKAEYVVKGLAAMEKFAQLVASK